MNIQFGVDYYPEHWPRERWEKDAILMKEMGIQVVRLAEFSWHKMEPKEGKYDFDWLEDIVNLLAKYEIKSILGTPSAAPPAWLVNKHPEILPVDRDGQTKGFGGRHHDCQSNPVYRDYVSKMVKAMAKTFGNNKNVVGWQIDNEFGNAHGDLCTCDSCRHSFQKWLKNKYKNVHALNKAWGTAFWSQEVNDFKEVFTPKRTATGENPSQMLDWKLFCSDLVLDFGKMQIDIIRKYSKKQFITHNYMGFADKINYYDLGKELDFVSHDQYTMNFYDKKPKNEPFVMASTLDVVRSFKDKPFWIMEQQSGICGWETLGRTPAPGQLSLWAMQTVAHGADTVVFFRWRTCAMGTEQYWHGILPHSGNPGRRYQELKEMIHSAKPVMKEIQGAMPKSEVGIVYSYAQNYALQIQPHHPELNYVKQLQKYYKGFYEQNVNVDFVPEDGDFSKYKLLVAPLQYLMTKEKEDKFIAYVKNGGHLVLTMRTGVKDEYNLCMTERELPGRLGEIAGIEILDYDCLNEAYVKIFYQENQYDSYIWSDIISPKDTTEVLGRYDTEFYKGEAAITKNAYEKGVCYYVGTEPSEQLMEILCKRMLADANIEGLGLPQEGVEYTCREKEGKKYLFILNHTSEEKLISIPEKGILVYGEKAGILNAYEVQIYEINS